ncbi:MAG TPA: M56 family metallopeptidase [Thermoanaerobaculia bacterium]|nr:M56 family metallopeptidase [Thermoanaerobaculia bacterium]
MSANWVESLAETLLRASLEGGLFAAAAWLAVRLSRRLGLPAGWLAAIWWLAAFKFVLALAAVRPFEIPVLPATENAVIPMSGAKTAFGARDLWTGRGAAGSPGALNLLGPTGGAPRGWLSLLAETFALSSPAVRSSGFPSGFPAPAILLGLWALGCAAQLPRALRALAHSRRIRRSAIPLDDPDQLAVAARIARRLGLPNPPPIFLASGLGAPQVAGILRPVVLMPREIAFAPDELALALGHELAHVKRRDLALGLVPALAERLFFFHPLARLAGREYALAREAACDSLVLAAVGAPLERYGRLLLRFGAVPQGLAFAAAGASPTFQTLKRRLLMLEENPKARRPRWLIVALAGAIAVAGLVPFRLTAQKNVASSEPAVRAIAHRAVSRPPTPPTPPTPPRPPKAPKAAHGSSTVWTSDRGDGFVILTGDDTTMSGSSHDVAKAKAARHGQEPLLWFEKGGKEYVVRDAATVEAARKLFEPQGELGARQGELGGRQGELGAKQGELGAKQGALGAKMGALGARQAKLGEDDEAADRELEKQMDELGKQMDELGEQMDKLGEQQDALGRQQDELGRQQDKLAAEAEKQMKKLVDDTLARGLAQEVH